MKRLLFVEPEAEGEIDEASRWYDSHSPGLGADFLRAVDAVLAAIQDNPHQFQTIYGEVRRAGLRRYPYGLMYVVSDQDIVVVACIHGRRHPKVWQERT